MNRTFLLGTAWTASAASAVGLGFLAVSLVDASATSPGTVPLAASTTATSSEDGAASSPASAPATAVRTEYTLAGTVTASCASGTPELSAAPAAGWWLDDSDDGDPGKVEFENGAQKLEVVVTCVNGSPDFQVEGPRADNSGRNGGGDDTVSPAPVATDAPDDSDGRDGGGHGADDPAGDDSSGRGGGGHGSDDSGSGSDDSGSGHGGGNSGSGHGGDDSGGDDSGGHGSDD
jgi:hypothetical protein